MEIELTAQNAEVQLGAQQLIKCNSFLERYDMSLSAEQAQELTLRRYAALESTDRVEFGDGILPELLRKFCASPYLSQQELVQTAAQLQECFYYFKNESLDLLSDSELLSLMRQAFDGPAHGSVELLADTELEKLCRTARGCADEDCDSDEVLEDFYD